MTRSFPGGWYVDAWPDGTRAVLLPAVRVVDTHVGPIPFDSLPLYTCCTRRERFQIAGQADNAFGTVHYYDGRAHLDPRIAHGNFGCLFDLAGTLHVIEPAPGQTSQGFAYVSSAGVLVRRDDDLLRHGVSSPIDLGDDILVGQGHASGGVVVWIDGALHRLQHGNCYAVKAHRAGDLVTISFYDVAADGLTAYIYDGLLSDLRALPRVDAVPAPPPTPPPAPTPKPEPVPMPETPDYAADIADIRSYYPTPLGHTHWAFLVEVAQWTETQLYRKEDSNSVLIPALGKRVSLDIIGRGSLGNRWADILQDSEGLAKPVFQLSDKPAEGEYVDVSQVALPGAPAPTPAPTPTPVPTPTPPPTGDLEARVAAIERWIRRAL